MPPPLLLSVKDASIRFSEKPVFENLSFNIHQGSRIALVGKNGAGKSTLMNIITGALDIDQGERWEEANISIGYLHQEVVAQKSQTVFDYIVQQIDKKDRDLHSYKVDIVTQALELKQSAQMTKLSGGQLRRAGLARALVEEPDILLLDEPTNHLDLEAIKWLEEYLKAYRGTLLCVSHDRTFLANVTTHVFWLDRGQLKVSPRGFKHFEEWSTMLMEQEERELKNRRQIVALEVEWASRGVKARRKRNMRRLEQMKQMRDQLKADQMAFKRASAKISLTPIQNFENDSRVVAEFYNVHKSFTETDENIKILEKFSLRIMRGDRIGILGKNGSGKTTFLKLLIGELEPDQGRVKRKKELEFSYFDQKRSDLDPSATLKKTLIPSGGDYLDVMGKQRHVCGYLKDFLFDPARVLDKVSMLSGGQKNRLMLAKILANPKTCLILDEPTNDLDMDTMDMLEETLSHYQGTLLVVSHDRDFLDQTVTKILAFEGDGKIDSCVGGYSDYLEMKEREASEKSPRKAQNPVKPKTEKPKIEEEISNPQPTAPAKKLTYKLERELGQIPEKIAEQEALIENLKQQLSDPDFYKRDPSEFHEATKTLSDAETKLSRYENRWLELEEMKQGQEQNS
jgi:ATP-binding cassette subfamily F protein uup